GADRDPADRGVPRRRPGPLPMARPAVRVRAHQASVRHPHRIIGDAPTDRDRGARGRDRALVDGRGCGVRNTTAEISALLTRPYFFASTFLFFAASRAMRIWFAWPWACAA